MQYIQKLVKQWSLSKQKLKWKQTLHEKCPNTEFFLVRIFPTLDWIRRDTSYLSVFSPNAIKIRIRKNSVFGHISHSERSSNPNDHTISHKLCLIFFLSNYLIYIMQTQKEYTTWKLKIYIKRLLQMHWTLLIISKVIRLLK